MCAIRLIKLLLSLWNDWNRRIKLLNLRYIFYLVTSMNVEEGIWLWFLITNWIRSCWHLWHIRDYLLRGSIAKMTIILSFFNFTIRHWRLLILNVLVIYRGLTIRSSYRSMLLVFTTHWMTWRSLLCFVKISRLLQKWSRFAISTWAHNLFRNILKILSTLLFKTFFNSVRRSWWWLKVWTRITTLSSKFNIYVRLF